MTIIVSRHRKWNTDKKNNRELDRKVTRSWIRRDGGRSRGGGGEVKESPKARTRKLKVQNRNNNSKNPVQTVQKGKNGKKKTVKTLLNCIKRLKTVKTGYKNLILRFRILTRWTNVLKSLIVS